MNFFRIFKALNHAFSTILSEETVSKNIKHLNSLILDITDAAAYKQTLDKNVYNSKLAEYEFSISNYENLIQEWTKFRYSFPDIIEPLLSNVAEFLYGLRMEVSLLKKLLIEYDFLMMEVDIQEIFLYFIKFPVLDNTQNDYNKHLEMLTDKKMSNLIEKILHNPENPHQTRQAVFRYIRSISL